MLHKKRSLEPSNLNHINQNYLNMQRNEFNEKNQIKNDFSPELTGKRYSSFVYNFNVNVYNNFLIIFQLIKKIKSKIII